jgi:TPR repeat protein
MLIVLLLLLLSACAQRGDDFFEAERFEAAADVYIQAAEQGDVTMMLRLAEMYAAGKIGYRRDYDNAVLWYTKAADLGVVSAMFELGFIYEYGQGAVAQDTSQAEYWYRQAAEHGHAYSQYRLAALLAQQLNNVEGDEALRAYGWFLIAERSAQACKNEPQCRIVIEDLFNFHWQLQQRLPEQQQTLARQQAAEWKKKAGP